MRILIWHVHGGWMNAFVQGEHEYLLPTSPERGPWGLGRGGRDWPGDAQEVRPEDVAALEPHVVVLQRTEELERAERLTGRRLGVELPAVFVEHNTPRGDVPRTRHPLADREDIPIVHVTHFNRIMWDNGLAPNLVIEHGIVDPGPLYTGELSHFAAVMNEPVRRSRVLGADLLQPFAGVAPVDLFGMGTEGAARALGADPERLRAAGDLPTARLHAELARRRAYLHPVRWTSLGLALLEAMHLGMPVLALAATEAGRAVPPEAGAVSTSPEALLAAARRLLADPVEARRRGAIARAAALERYGLRRFLNDWDGLLADQTERSGRPHAARTTMLT